MTPDWITGGSLLLNSAIALILLVVRSSPKNRRRLAAWLWASANAMEAKAEAWRRIESEAREYEGRLVRRAEGEEPRLARIDS